MTGARRAQPAPRNRCSVSTQNTAEPRDRDFGFAAVSEELL